MKLNFKTRKLKGSIEKVNLRYKDLSKSDFVPIVYGVTKDDGICITGNETSDDLSEYIVFSEHCFAYNPYRINIGSIGLSKTQQQGLVSPAYVVFKTKEDIEPEFLFFYLKSEVGLAQINWHGNRGGVRNALRYDALGEIDFPDLTRAEQKKALKLINKSKDDLDSLTNEINSQLSNIQLLRQAILQEAVQGKLVPQDPTDEPAIELLKRIKAEKAKQAKKGKTETYEPITDAPYVIPDGWVWCRLNQLVWITGGGTPSTGNASYWNGNIPWVSPKDMKSVYIDNSEDKITLTAVENSTAKLVPPYSILVVGRSGILKRTLPVSICTVECTVNQDIKVLVPYINETVEYLRLLLKGYESFILNKLVKYGMTVHSLMYKEFENQIYPIPPLNEQKRIVTKVQQLMQLCDELESQVKQSKADAEKLLQAVLREAFEGNKKYKTQDAALSLAAEP